MTDGPCGEVRAGREVLEPSLGPCGTGALPEPSKRFLWLYAGRPAKK